jgi:pimeloyl-ACP methyl ester carboxylesterase
LKSALYSLYERRAIMNNNSKKHWVFLAIALALILVGSLLGGWIHTGAGAAVIKDIRYAGTNGFVWVARLYVPKGVTNENPAPAVFMSHGGDASNEIMANSALEFARRGYVVLNIDMSGHGYSEKPSRAYGMGGADLLGYLRSLDIVDKDNIALIGMSMGSEPVASAADTYPDGYNSIFYMDSGSNFPNPTAMFAPEAYRNVMLNWGTEDEYTQMAFGVTSPVDVPNSTKIKSTFGTSSPVEVGKIYGSIEDGTARVLKMPWDTHVSTMDSNRSIGNAIEWIQMTTQGEKELPASNQIWRWKVVGTAAAFIGIILFMFPMGALLLGLPFFKPLADKTAEFKGLEGIGWWIGAVIITAIGPLFHSWLYSKGQRGITATSFWPQAQTNGYLGYTVAIGAVAVILALFNHFVITRKRGATAVNYGLAWEGRGLDWGKIGKSLLLAICILIPAYLLLLLMSNLLKIDFRYSFLALRVMDLDRFKAFLGYLVPFTFFYFAFGVILHGFMRVKNGKASLATEMLVNVALWAVGIYVWDFFNYAPAFFGDGLPSNAFSVLRAFPLLFLWPAYALLSTYFFRKTGRVYVGAFLIGIFATWYIAANSSFAVLPW